MLRKLSVLVFVLFVCGVALASPQASSSKQPPAESQPSPAELAKRKSALKSRVTELYTLAKAGEWRKMEAMMTEDSKDAFYGQSKNPISEFEVKGIEVAPDGKSGRAVVDIKFRPGGFSTFMVLPQRSKWVYENETWLTKLEKPIAHPAGAFMPAGDAAPVNDVRFEKREIEIERGAHEYVIRFQNAGRQALTVNATPDPCGCMEVSLDKEKYAPGESGQLRINTELDKAMEPRQFRVQVLAQPGSQWTILLLRLK